MLIRNLMIAAGAVALAACQQMPVDESAAATQSAAAVQTASAGDPDEEICRREHVTGSIHPRKICMTRAQWDSQREASRDGVNEIQRRALSSCVPSAGGGGCGG